jgi:hypothetical protein
MRKLLLEYGAHEEPPVMEELRKLFGDNKWEELEERLKERGVLDKQGAAFWERAFSLDPQIPETSRQSNC